MGEKNYKDKESQFRSQSKVKLSKVGKEKRVS